MPIEPLVFTASEVAVMLGVTSTRTISRYVKKKWLPRPLRIGDKRLWTRAQVDAFLVRAAAGDFRGQSKKQPKATPEEPTKPEKRKN